MKELLEKSTYSNITKQCSLDVRGWIRQTSEICLQLILKTVIINNHREYYYIHILKITFGSEKLKTINSYEMWNNSA